MEEKAVLPTSSSGGEWMLPFTTWARVHTLAHHGRSIRGIAHDLDLDRKTVRRALRQSQPEPYHRTARVRLLAPHEAYLRVRAPELDYNSVRLFQELHAQGYTGGYETVKRAVRRCARPSGSWQRPRCGSRRLRAVKPRSTGPPLGSPSPRGGAAPRPS